MWNCQIATKNNQNQRHSNTAALLNKLAVQRKIGVPYAPMTAAEIQQACDTQASGIAGDLKNAGAEVPPEREIVALIAYLQKLGKAEKVAPAEVPKTATR